MKHKKKKSPWFFKIVAFPFKLIGKTIYYTGKGVYLGIKGTIMLVKRKSEQKKIEKEKPKSAPQYHELKELKKLEGNKKDFEKIIHSRGKIGIILGGRGTGKSALGMKIIENVHAKNGSRVYTMGFDDKRMPDWITSTKDISNIANDSFILIDESGINFSSRNSMNNLNKLLTELLLIARHKNISILFITQNSANIEINIIRQADYLLLKPHSLLQLDFERKIIKDIYEQAEEHFKELKEQGTTYVFSSDYKGLIKNELPSFWSDRLSKSFSNEIIDGK